MIGVIVSSRLHRSPSPSARLLAWALGLALLLPAAQAFTIWHQVGHATGAAHAGRPQAHTGSANDPATSSGVACAICLTCAAVGAGGLPSALPATPACGHTHAVPATGPIEGHRPVYRAAYRSRAPPLPLR